MGNATIFSAWRLSRTLVVRISRDRIQVRHVESGRTVMRDAPRPFSSSRLLVAEFGSARNLLRQVVREVSGGFGLAPVLLIHPTEITEGGVSESEERLLLDLGYECGARDVAVVREDLSDEAAMAFVRSRCRLRA